MARKEKNQYVGELNELLVVEQLGGTIDKTLKDEAIKHLKQKEIETIEKVSKETTRVINSYIPKIKKVWHCGNSVGTQLGDIKIDNKSIELKYISSGTGTWHNTSMAYFNHIKPYNDFLKEHNYYEDLKTIVDEELIVDEGMSPIPNYKSLSKSQFDDITILEGQLRELYVKTIYDYYNSNKEELKTLYIDMLTKKRTGSNKKKGIPDLLVIQNSSTGEVNVLTKHFIKSLIKDGVENISNQGKSIKLGKYIRLAIGWQNHNGCSNPTIRAFLDEKLLNKGVDQFYTNKEVANKCIDTLFDLCKDYIEEEDIFMEPSAGTGSFLDKLPEKGIYLDLEPKNEKIEKNDFITYDLTGRKDLITVGNPPFGKRSTLAIQFFNKAIQHSKIVAFIVPKSFDKYTTQKKLNVENFALIHSETLPKYSFTNKGKKVNVNCVFQIWVRKDINKMKDLKKKPLPPDIKRKIQVEQHNGTEQSLKRLNELKFDYDFAVYRQGYKDYTLRFKDKKEIQEKMENSSDQFFFIKCEDEKLLKQIENLDFNELAMMNTTTPGFGKEDFYRYFISKKEEEV